MHQRLNKIELYSNTASDYCNLLNRDIDYSSYHITPVTITTYLIIWSFSMSHYAPYLNIWVSEFWTNCVNNRRTRVAHTVGLHIRRIVLKNVIHFKVWNIHTYPLYETMRHLMMFCTYKNDVLEFNPFNVQFNFTWNPGATKIFQWKKFIRYNRSPVIEPIVTFLKKWANPGLFLFIFVLFLLQFQHKLKKA